MSSDASDEFYRNAFRALRIGIECMYDDLLASLGAAFRPSELKCLTSFEDGMAVVGVLYEGALVLEYQMEMNSREASCTWTRLSRRH